MMEEFEQQIDHQNRVENIEQKIGVNFLHHRNCEHFVGKLRERG